MPATNYFRLSGKFGGKKKLKKKLENMKFTLPAQDAKKVLSSLADRRYEWRTVEGVSKDTGVSVGTVISYIKSQPNVVIQSRVPDKNGRALFTTRDHYRFTHSLLQRFADVYGTTHT